MAKGRIIEVDPSTLTIAVNVRRDVKLDKEFVSSIKQHGVLQPPMVVKKGDGYEVVIGQRRTLAAAQAKLPKIEAYLVTRAEADAARVVDQLTENEHRQGLSDVERVGGYKELALFGVTPAEIAKRMAAPKERVQRALAVADSEVASEAMRESQLTLDQAAEIVEFEDDKAAVKRLREAAESSPAQFRHLVAELRSKRALKAELARAKDEIVAAGAEALKETDWAYSEVKGWSKLSSLGTIDDPEVPLEREAVAAEQLGGRPVRNWRDGHWSYDVQWFVCEGHEFPEIARASAPLTPEDEERQAQWAAEQKARDEANAAQQAARNVRVAWIRDELLQRKTVDVVAFVAEAVTSTMIGAHYGEVDDEVLEMLGIELGDEVEVDTDDEVPEIAALRKRIRAGKAWQVLLAMALAGVESEFRYRAPSAEYLEQLEAWGYGLSAFEKEIVEGAKGAKGAQAA